MKREVIQDFLNLPGIAGVALMDGRSRPYFCGIDQSLNFQQKEALAQGILQVVETIPDGFDVFEFQFAERQVRLYRLDRGMVLLVLTHQGLVYADYLGIINQLKAVLQEDMPNAIATFRLLAGNITLTGMHYRKHSADAVVTSPTIAPVDVPQPDNTPALLEHIEHSPASVQAASVQAASVRATASVEATANVQATDSVMPRATLKEAIAALNHLSQFTTPYLGTHVIANYWKATRPQSDWLAAIQIDRAAQFSLTGTLPQSASKPLTEQEQLWLQEWVAAFIKRCAQVIRDFPAIVEQKALNAAQKTILLG